MRLFARFITILARICGKIAGLVFRIQQLLTEILPAMLPPKELTRLIRNHYDDSYQDMEACHPETYYKWTLESWEEDVIVRHNRDPFWCLEQAWGANLSRWRNADFSS